MRTAHFISFHFISAYRIHLISVFKLLQASFSWCLSVLRCQGASTVYAMPCGLAQQPVQPVLQMRGAFGLALVSSDLESSAATATAVAFLALHLWLI